MELTRRELNHLAVLLENIRRAVQLEPADLIHLVLDALRCTPTERTQTRKELGELKGLNEIVIRTCIQPRDTILH